MKKIIFFALAATVFATGSCDKIENPYPQVQSLELDTTLYPGLWSDYIENEWPVFTANTNTNRNVLIEDFTGHTCVFCPAAADLAHALHEANPARVFTAGIHAGPDGIGDFQALNPPNYPTDFTNPQGVEIGLWFGINDEGFPGNPRGPINRITQGGAIFQSPASWTSMTNSQLSGNNLRVNIQAKLNYYPSTKGAFLHTEIEKLVPLDDLGVVVYLIEDSLVGDQKMSDNSHNTSYIHRDIMRSCIDERAFGRTLKTADFTANKAYLDYSFLVPNQLNGVHNPSNMHLLIYVYDKLTLEILQVIKQKIE